MHRGMFITFEGVDGSGKSTHARRALDYLEDRGFHARLVREPGDTAIGEKIRSILLDRTNVLSPLTELLLYEAARAELTRTIIQPALTRGEIIIADRFFDSTTAYQGYGRGLELEMINSLNRQASDGLIPNLTLLFDLPLHTAMTRRGKEPDRLEAESISFFERVRSGYLALARAEPKRFHLIDSSSSADEVFMRVKAKLDAVIGSHANV